MLDKETGKIYLIDFGIVQQKIAKAIGGSTMFGTMGYSAPEVFAGQATTQSDLYSLGPTMLKLASGIPPEDVLNGFNLDYSGKFEFKNPSLGVLVDQLVQFDPELRPKSVDEVADYLQRIKEGKSLVKRKEGGRLKRFLSRLVPDWLFHYLVRSRPDEAKKELQNGVIVDAGSGDSDSGQSYIKIIDAKDFITLENVVCYGSDGKVSEQHDKLAFAKDIVRQKDGKGYASFTPYNAILHFEEQNNGLFLPSYACQTVALVALFQASVRKRQDGSFEVINPELEKFLQRYKNYGPGHGYHNNNTIVDGAGGRIIHYPSKDDFPQHGGTADINTARVKVVKTFPVDMNRDHSSLEDALKDPQKLAYHKDLTGLKNLGILLDLATYLGRTAWAWPAASDCVCAAWLGCDYDNLFSIGTLDFLNINIAARGVRRH
jgi:serine/threonine protein kinase